ncbi:hypothetical protein VE01_01509 [Pseudogymnoascus verrucosus]|uniref:Uncharacterized protein n=1 Tax=Pseudogymnoascus verrucosus TaxID=342668 RepID=A0A1B8GWV5_9PEZI|nr:uncharacterized protein VE01_01509 [Pseudogymnoascus verrucosus]OBU00318.2 hypothetical protein VE01_01509 [Pseudogymnoascus verrucosus]
MAGGSYVIGGPRSAWDKQFVWPREGRKGKTPRGWWGGLMSIMTNTGPDIFITRKNDTTPIKPDHWGNWDSYDSPEAQARERRNYAFNADRGNRRYDPHTRKYVLWEFTNNYDQDPVEKYPLFTREEHEWLARHPRKRRPKTKDWSAAGPKRFRREHNDFWRDAFRIGENIRNGIPEPEASPTVNPGLFMDDAWRNLYDRRQGRWPSLRRRTGDDSLLIENTRYNRGQMRGSMHDYGLYEDDRLYDGEDYEDRSYYPY